MKDKIEFAFLVINIILAIFQLIREINNILKTYIIYKKQKQNNIPIDWKEANKIFWDKDKLY